MTKIRLWVVGAISIALLTIVVGWSIGVAPQLTIASNAHRDRAQVISLNNRSQLFLLKLRRDYQNLAVLQNQLDALQISVPANSNLSAFISELDLLAKKGNLTVNSIQFSDPKPYSPIIQNPNSAGGGGAALPLTNSKISAANFVVIPLQISVSGIYSEILDFVNDLQLGPRLFLVSTLSSTGSTDARSGVRNPPLAANPTKTVDLSIGGYIYVLLD